MPEKWRSARNTADAPDGGSREHSTTTHPQTPTAPAPNPPRPYPATTLTPHVCVNVCVCVCPYPSPPEHLHFQPKPKTCPSSPRPPRFPSNLPSSLRCPAVPPRWSHRLQLVAPLVLPHAHTQPAAFSSRLPVQCTNSMRPVLARLGGGMRGRLIFAFGKVFSFSMIDSSINVNQPLQSATAERHYAAVSRSTGPATDLQPPYHSPNPSSNYPLSSDYPQTAESEGRRLSFHRS